MRTLIDGYNLMFGLVPVGKALSPDRFRKSRLRFLNRLADALGAVEAHQTTVVFDAASPPDGLPDETSHKGMTILYAVDDDSADSLIERLIAGHTSPKGLTVVSSDHRIRQAALRRKAVALSTDEFLNRLERPRRAAEHPSPPPSPEERARMEGLSADEAALWREVFRDVADETDLDAALGHGGFIPTDEEIARIEREVDDEFKRQR